ncbi:N-acetylmuramoyl-L-alanine amidase [Aggregatibacter actinomycetemcomitans]|uniref:N-acetylmuramoyl-L-alanine amidase n=1 Tax=Aggregatibacter actinomycetemcomitans TaxID=714 RepID=UPI00197C83AD|nr:N-acetylmuramoyl-L-alanine amidase [Aggregatibacter actinomycetemcomitans]MBN6076729.1 N-acetylmuramoyl-L-alanine amidase [Aggregatibacter actinomycetemcomitans]
MFKERMTKIELHKNGEGQEYCIEIDDKAATRQAIINNVKQALEKKYGTKFLERSAWKAKAPKKALTEGWYYDSIVIHHQGNSGLGFICGNPIHETAKIQEEETNPNGSQNFDDIGYHYVVGCNGNILEGRDIRFIGAHVNRNNSKKIGILLLGDYSERGEVDWDKTDKIKDYIIDHLDIFNALSVPTIQGYACITLIESLISVFCIDSLGGHREFALPSDYRTCPGNIGMKFVNYLRKHFKLKAPENNNE